MTDRGVQPHLHGKKKKLFEIMLAFVGTLACIGLVYVYSDVRLYQKPSESPPIYIDDLQEESQAGDGDIPQTQDVEKGETSSTASEPVVVQETRPQVSQPLNDMLGISLGETLSIASESEVQQILDDISSLGVGWIRVDVAWNSIQPVSKDAFVWGPFDRIVREARKRGIAVLPILTYTPQWARDESCRTTSKCPPANPEDFAEFAHTAVLRYAPQGISVWEVWNEPNLRKFWASGADYARYTELLRFVYQAIHETDTNALVLSGGLAPTGTGGGNITAREFLEGMYEFGAKSYFDAVAFHPYSYPLGPEDIDTTNAWSHMTDTEWNLRAIMQDNGDGYKKIWITEYGAPTGGPGSIASNSTHVPWSIPDHVTEEYQAKLLEQAVKAQRTHAWSGPLFWYSYQDLGTNESTVENFFGIIRYDGTQKPAYGILKRLLAVQ